MCQEAFDEKLTQMLRDVPELMTDEPIAEIKWYDAVNDVRNTIASRWLDIIRLRSLVPSSHFQKLVDRMRQKIETVVEIHGQELPFCLEPDLELDKVSDKDTPNDPSAATTSEPRNSSSSSTATEQVKMVPHTFKFFQVSAECVWSVVQAWCLQNPCIDTPSSVSLTDLPCAFQKAVF